jgi:uncharacterized protein YcfJ
MRITLRTVLGLAGVVIATQAAAQVTFYEREDFRGRSFTVDRPLWNMDRAGFDDKAASAVIDSGNWQVCEDPGFRGRCAVLQPGQYRTLREVGLNRDISSIRPAEGHADYGYDRERYNIAQNDQQYRPRGEGRVVEVPVTSVRAVVGPPEQRCWVERQEIEGRGAPNIGGAIAGAVIGGVLGHQIGSGRGRDVATAGGAVAGGALGANIGRNGEVYSQDVQRCASVPSNAPPDYWDVTYTFRGQVHHVQTSAPPGPTITVDGNTGEPRM